MNDRRTFIGSIVAFAAWLVLGQQEHFTAPERPGKIKIICQRASVQYDFPLEVVGLDQDGNIKRLNELNRDPI